MYTHTDLQAVSLKPDNVVSPKGAFGW